METYTLEDVEQLLKVQRQICYDSAFIEEVEYNNPYSASDGEITRRINKESIVNAKSPIG